MNKTIQVINHFRSDDHKGGLAVMLKHTSGDSFVYVTTAHCSYDDAYNKKVAVQKLNENFDAGAKIKVPLVPGMRKMTHQQLRDSMFALFSCYAE